MSNHASDNSSVEIEVLAETELYSVWRASEPDGERTYHIEFGSVTVHFFEEEWKEARNLFGMLSE